MFYIFIFCHSFSNYRESEMRALVLYLCWYCHPFQSHCLPFISLFQSSQFTNILYILQYSNYSTKWRKAAGHKCASHYHYHYRTPVSISHSKTVTCADTIADTTSTTRQALILYYSCCGYGCEYDLSLFLSFF